jgi:pyrroloquinoline quinone biosynthesis protein D
MSDAAKSPKASRTIIGAASQPAVSHHVKMRHDPVRDRWAILAPERVFALDAIAVAVLHRCDGTRTVGAIADELAQTYSAPAERILADIVPMLQDLADKGVVTA